MKYILKILNKSQKKKLGFLTILMIINAGFEVLTLNLIFIIINYFSNPEQFANNNLLIQIEKLGITTNLTITLFLLLLLSFLLKTLSQIVFYWSQSKTIQNLRAQLSLYYFRGYLNLPRLFHLRINISEIVKNITYEVDYFVAAIFSVSTIIMELIILVSLVAFLIFINPKVAGFSFLVLVVFAFIIHALNSNIITMLGKERPKRLNARFKLIIEGLSGSKIFKLAGRKDSFIENFNIQNNRLAKIFQIITFRNNLPRPLFELLILFLIIFLVVIFLNKDNNILAIIPILGTFLAAGYRLVPSFGKIISNIQNYQFYIQSGLKLYRDKVKFESSQNKQKQTNLNIFKNAIELKNISFSYEKNLSNHEKFIFKNLNLKIMAGQKIGIMGDSGTGKSSLLDLIMGLLPTTNGEVLIDGININLVQDSWQNKIGCVPQDVFIADDSLKRNIAFGLKDLEVNNNKIEKVLRISNLQEFSSNLKFGVNSLLGEQGARISGGQRQRIGIARAMFNDPEILILDEITNALDFVNEKKVIDEIFNNAKNKTVIIVSHNKENFRFCDTVYTIQNKDLKKVN